MTQQPKELLEKLSSGVKEIHPGGKKSLEDLLKAAEKEKRKLRVKLGIDPTSTDLHLGHMVCIQKLKQFQDAGHQVVLIIGGFTAQIGDPSGRTEARPPLTKAQVDLNARTYLDQVKKVLDLSKTEIVNNADWFDKFSLMDIMQLASKATLSQMLAKETFRERLKIDNPVFINETLYPLFQGHDSVEVRSDIEIGGTDQTFNLLVGRDLQKDAGQKPQLIMTLPLLVGLDGVKKMSKTSNNFIAIQDSPELMFSKTMSIPDELIVDYYVLAAGASETEAKEIAAMLKDPKINPRDLKAELGKKIVSIYYDAKAAAIAEEAFVKQFREHQIPDDIPEFKLKSPMRLADLMLEAKTCESKAEAKRLVAGGGVKLDGEKQDDFMKEISLNGNGTEKILQVGKRKFVKLVK